MIRAKDVVAVLTDADPAEKRAIYDEVGVNRTYTHTEECTSTQAAEYSGFVSEGGLVDRRDAILLTRTVQLAA